MFFRIFTTIHSCLLTGCVAVSLLINSTVAQSVDELTFDGSFDQAPIPGVVLDGDEEPTAFESEEDYIEDASKVGNVFPNDIPELAAFQKQLNELTATTEELRADLEAEKKKNNKEVKKNDPFKVKFGGHVSLDAVSISQNDESRVWLGNTKNSFDVRDVRIQMTGSGHGKLEYRAVVGVNNSLKIYDAYLRFKDTQYLGDIMLGQFFIESGMESTTTTFERAFVSLDEGANEFRLNRHIGVGSIMFGQNKQARAMFGAFIAPATGSSPHYVCDNDPGLVLNTRLTRTPIMDIDEDGFTHEVFHLGASHYWLCPGGETDLHLRTRGQLWNGSNPYFIDGKISLNDRSYSMSQAEVAYQREGFATTAEGYVLNVYEGGGSAYGATVVARLMLTPGSSRRYDADKARFSSVKMSENHVFLNYKERAIGNNWGAWEALAKWEWTETNNFQGIPNALYGTTNRVVVGGNWFWNEQTFLALNWERAFVSANRNSKKAHFDFSTIVAQMTFRF